MDQSNPSEEDREKFEHDIKEILISYEGANKGLLSKCLDENGEIDIELARIASQKFVNVHNANKIESHIGKHLLINYHDEIELSTMPFEEKQALFADIVLAAHNIDYAGYATEVVSRIRLDGKPIYNEDKIITIDEAMNLFNANFLTNYDFRQPEFKEILNSRLLNRKTFEIKLASIIEEIEERGSEEPINLDEQLELKRENEAKNDLHKKEYQRAKAKIESKRDTIPSGSIVESDIIKFLNDNVQIENADCANVLNVKYLYVRECERDFREKYGRSATTPEERKKMFLEVEPDSAAGAIKTFMQTKMAFFGDILANGDSINVDSVEKMLEENKLKEKQGNVKDLLKSIEYIASISKTKDDVAKETLKQVERALKDYKKQEKML